MIDSHDERFLVEPDTFGATPPLAPERREEALAYICDELCKYLEGRTQEELDVICEKHKLGRGAQPRLCCRSSDRKARSPHPISPETRRQSA